MSLRKICMQRVLAIVPLVGDGSRNNPTHPLHAPLPFEMQANAKSHSGILAFHYEVSDDGKHALVEFVGRDASALRSILGDPSIRAFLKGRDSFQGAIAAFQAQKKNFDPTKFFVRVQ